VINSTYTLIYGITAAILLQENPFAPCDQLYL